MIDTNTADRITRSAALEQALRFNEERAKTTNTFLGTDGILEAATAFMGFLQGTEPAKAEEAES
ncbi:hypothetical protein SEA_UPYO_61 [Gordonia phage Upyo]|nr:hypothetical protein SEA_UPYO_61 [Gordonia phage Upyo]